MKKLIALVLLTASTLALADASNCSFITSNDGRNYCIAVVKKDRSYCGFINDNDRRNMCIAVATQDPSYCGFINNFDNRNQCRGQVGN